MRCAAYGAPPEKNWHGVSVSGGYFQMMVCQEQDFFREPPRNPWGPWCARAPAARGANLAGFVGAGRASPLRRNAYRESHNPIPVVAL
jgi:hypothetical protein